MKLRDITPRFENKEIEFDCIILGVSDRKTYVKKGTVECPSCHTTNDVECDEYRRIHFPRCNVRSCHGITKQLNPSTVETGYIQTVMIQEPIEEVENNSALHFVAKLHITLMPNNTDDLTDLCRQLAQILPVPLALTAEMTL